MYAICLTLSAKFPCRPTSPRRCRRSCRGQNRYQSLCRPLPVSGRATAGLHFTEALLTEIRAMGVRVCFVTLHVGPGTFAPVKAETPAGHVMARERYELDEVTARTVN